MITSIIPPSYKASARISFESTLQRYMQTNKVTNEPIIDDTDKLGQSYVIASESILLQVVRSLSLASDPDFVEGKDNESLGRRVRGLFRNVAQALGFPKELADDQSIQQRNDPEKIAFDRVARDLTVSREDVASVMTIDGMPSVTTPRHSWCGVRCLPWTTWSRGWSAAVWVCASWRPSWRRSRRPSWP